MRTFYDLLRRGVAVVDECVFRRLSVTSVCVLSLVYMVCVYGLGTLPGDSFFDVSQNPFINIYRDNPRGQHLYDSPAVPLLTYFTGLNRHLASFNAFSLFLILGGNMLLIARTSKKYGVDFAKLICLLFALSPVSVVLLTWIGGYDSLTFFLQCLVFFASNTAGLFLIGIIGGLNHFPVMLVSGMCLLWFKMATRGGISKRHLFAYASGLGLGYALVKRYQQYYHLDLAVNRLTYQSQMRLGEFAHNVFGNWHTFAFSLYNVLWLVVVFVVFYLARKNSMALIAFMISNCAFLVCAVAVIDTTRIFAMCSWPLLFAAILYVATGIRQEGSEPYAEWRAFFSAVLMAGLVTPRLVVWQGAIYSSTSLDMAIRAVRSAQRLFGR